MRTTKPGTQNSKLLKQMMVRKIGCIVNVLLSWRRRLFPVIGRFGFVIVSRVLELESRRLTEPEDSLGWKGFQEVTVSNLLLMVRALLEATWSLHSARNPWIFTFHHWGKISWVGEFCVLSALLVSVQVSIFNCFSLHEATCRGLKLLRSESENSGLFQHVLGWHRRRISSSCLRGTRGEWRMNRVS